MESLNRHITVTPLYPDISLLFGVILRASNKSVVYSACFSPDWTTARVYGNTQSVGSQPVSMTTKKQKTFTPTKKTFTKKKQKKEFFSHEKNVLLFF